MDLVHCTRISPASAGKRDQSCTTCRFLRTDALSSQHNRWYIHLSSYVLVSGLYSIPRTSIQSTCVLAIALARRLASSLSIMRLMLCSVCTMPDALCLILIHPWG